MSTIEVESNISLIDVQAAVILPVIKETFPSPSIDTEEVGVSAIEEDSPQNTESLNKNNAVPSSDLIRKKKKKIRAIRKFLSLFCYKRKLKDS